MRARSAGPAPVSNHLSKWLLPALVPAALSLGAACSSEPKDDPFTSGGNGGSATATGGRAASGGSVSGGSGTGGQANPEGGKSAQGGATGGSSSGGKAGASGGMPSSTGGATSGGTQGSSGSGTTGGASGGASGGAVASGGAAGDTGTGGDGTAGDTGTGGKGASTDERPWFSFFVTSLEGLLMLAPDKTNGFGGDFGGLEGADEICATLAKRGNPTDDKVWRAFLSTAGVNGQPRVDAIDRVGPGPWYDLQGRLLAENVEGLDPQSNNGRPDGSSQLVDMFTTELGEPMRPDQSVDNHDTLTGSDRSGRLHEDGEAATCNDWTSNTLRGRIPVGHGWPRSQNNGRQWIHDHTVNGCEPGVFIELGGGAPRDNYTVGGGGGYGAFYCFALGATPPPP